jgi:hypothetical protein
VNIKLHIERVVLEGLPVQNLRLLRQTLERKLTQLLAEGGLSQRFRSGGAVPHLGGGTIRAGKSHSTKQIGADVARAVYHGIGNNR